tara:strand:- start:181 stop:450 length:270 start_codon:yes stop_codon:yes gene_type:complete
MKTKSNLKMFVFSTVLDQTNMSNIMYECRSCLSFYDGAAQCCLDMQHVAYWVDEHGHRSRPVNWEKDFDTFGEDFDDHSFDRIKDSGGD